MAELRHDQIVVELWPSLEEIRESTGSNKYRGRLTEFYDSVDSLLQSHGSDSRVQAFTDYRLHKGDPVARAFPPEIVELAAWLGSSGVALALYKALRLWVEFKNGRRIKIVDGGLEVEATQLTQEQFVELLEVLRETRETFADSSKTEEALAHKGLNPVPVDSTQGFKERRALKDAVRSRAKPPAA
jgi:hypothetical protein